MRRGYDPSYGSREQLKDSAERNMTIARERDALKAENAALLDEIKELKALIAYITEGEQ
jgi:cell division protein FtsB